MINIENVYKNIYDLFLNHKYKTLFDSIKNKPDLLNVIINDNKTIIEYAIQSNNLKLLKKLINLNPEVLFNKNINNLNLVHIAIEYGLNNIIFYLIDKFIELKKDDFIFKLSDYHILRGIKDFNLLESYIKKYFDYINWFELKESSYIFYILNNFPNKIDYVINLTKQIIKKYKDPTDLFKLPKADNSLFFLIYLYYKPSSVKFQNQLFSDVYKNFNVSREQLKEFIKLFPPQLNYQNQVSKTVIYYIAEANDIEMLKYCIELGADINHISLLGYNNFCHSVMKYSNINTINYVLNLNINCNHLDQNNETPIYNLLRNKDNTVESIYKLLEKTNDWDSQNIYGQSIMHILCYRLDIDKFYDLFKIRYFNLNLKNRMNISVIKILEDNYKHQKLNQKQIEQKIRKIKELLSDNFLEILTTTESIDIPEDIKINCSKKSDKCLEILINNLSKPEITDIDKLSDNYKNIHIDDYLFAHFNLYNARDVDVYIYYLILLEKYDNLGIPINDRSFDLSKAFSGKIKKTHNNIQEIEYLELLITNTTKNYMLYPLNIYWIDRDNFMIPHNLIHCINNSISIGKKFIIIRLNLISEVLHANIILIDVVNKKILRFEPQGGISKDEFIDIVLEDYFTELKNYHYIKPKNYEPISGFQSLSQETNIQIVRKGDINGFCVAWCLWWVEFYIQNHSNALFTDKKFNTLVSKTIKKIINSGYLITEYIRNYANHMHKKLVQYLTNRSFNYNSIYYERYTDNELETLYKLINKEIQDS